LRLIFPRGHWDRAAAGGTKIGPENPKLGSEGGRSIIFVCLTLTEQGGMHIGHFGVSHNGHIGLI
jgi:hypothetical protein